MSSENNKKVCDLFLMGRSTTEIGVICGFSRQRAHQILKSNGLSRNDGGVCRRKLNNKTKASLRRGNSINPAFGITYKRWRFYRSIDNDYSCLLQK